MTIGSTPLEEYPERIDEYIEKYYNLVLEKAPKNRMFSIPNLFDIPLQTDEYRWMIEVQYDVCAALINDGFIKYESGSNLYLRLTEKGKNKRDGVKDIQHTTNNYHAPVISDSVITNAQIIQDSFLETNNSPITNNVNEIPIKNEPKSKWDNLSKIIFPILVKIVWGLAVLLAGYLGYELLG